MLPSVKLIFFSISVGWASERSQSGATLLADVGLNPEKDHLIDFYAAAQELGKIHWENNPSHANCEANTKLRVRYCRIGTCIGDGSCEVAVGLSCQKISSHNLGRSESNAGHRSKSDYDKSGMQVTNVKTWFVVLIIIISSF